MQPYKRVLWIGMAAACVSFAIGQPASAQFGPAQVAVSPVVEREVAVGQTFVGTVMPLKKAMIGSAVDGRVSDYPHNAGDRVEGGQPLAQLLTTTIELEWATAQAELNLRKEQLAELRNGTRPEELEQARARMLGAEATMNHLKARRARVEGMFASNRAVSEEERDAAVSASIAAAQAYEDARQAHEMARIGPRKEQIAQAEAQVAMQQATADRLKDQLGKHTIISRFSGYVTAEHTEVGQWVKQGDPMIEVSALDEVEIVAQVVEQYVPFSRVGATATVQVPALANLPPFVGQVSAVVPQADVQARTFPVHVRVKNVITDDGQPLLKAGMYARVTLPTGLKQRALLVPKDALFLGGGPQPIVYVVDSGGEGQPGKARAVPVEVGVAVGGLVQVRGQLAAGEMVVVQGNERLRPPFEVIVQRVIPTEGAADVPPTSSLQP